MVDCAVAMHDSMILPANGKIFTVTAKIFVEILRAYIYSCVLVRLVSRTTIIFLWKSRGGFPVPRCLRYV